MEGSWNNLFSGVFHSFWRSKQTWEPMMGDAQMDDKQKDKKKEKKKEKNKEKDKSTSPVIDFSDPKYFTNRELSWVKFDLRVLNEAMDKNIPLFERIKFLSITSSNLDEFFMVRVASLKDMVRLGYTQADIAGMLPQEQLSKLEKAIHELVSIQYDAYNKELIPLLKENGIQMILRHEDLSNEEAEYVDNYFRDNVYPVLTPMAVDSSRPFPLIRNSTLNIGALVKKKSNGKEKVKDKELEFATVQVPSVLPRIVEIPSKSSKHRKFILLEEIIEKNVASLFLNYDIICEHPFRITRNADLAIAEDEVSDLLKEIEKQLKKRQWGHAIRLEVEAGINQKLLDRLVQELDVSETEIYRIEGPLDLTFLMKMYDMDGYDHLKDVPYVPQPVPEIANDSNIFDQIRQHDILLFHPYQTFSPVVEFVKQAAKDPQVLAIKQTLYRVGGNSPIVAALAQAAENGKQVSVLVELKARFDEENNIEWAKTLEKAGCHVIYGLVGLKTHCKITLVVRREGDGIVRYVHLGTGNYNDSTAKLYTDMGLLTSDEAYGADATAVFNMLSGYSEPLTWNKLSLAPLWLKDKFLMLIHRETENARKGRPAKIIAKMNSLCDKDIIQALYEASNAGVKIKLIVRGICCLKVGIPGVSENITVRSIVGKFLEHSRIFYFENNGKREIYMGSADWMPRNLERRVEILFPIEKEKLQNKALHILEYLLNDNVKAKELTPDNVYKKIDHSGKNAFNCQEEFCKEAIEAGRVRNEPLQPRVFVPKTPSDGKSKR